MFSMAVAHAGSHPLGAGLVILAVFVAMVAAPALILRRGRDV